MFKVFNQLSKRHEPLINDHFFCCNDVHENNDYIIEINRPFARDKVRSELKYFKKRVHNIRNPKQ